MHAALLALSIAASVTAAAAVWAWRRARADAARLGDALQHLAASTALGGMTIWEWDLRSNRMIFPPGSTLSMQLGGAATVDRSEFHEKFVHPDDRAAMESAFDAVIHAPAGNGDRFIARCRRMLPDGGECHVELHTRAVRDAAGRVVRFVGMSRDVTAEVEATRALEQQAERLREAERRLERASRSSLEGHWEVCYRTRTRWHSSSFRALLGYPPVESVGPFESLREHTHPDDLHIALEAVERHLESAEPLDSTIRLEMSDGSYRWFRLRGGVERDECGRVLRVSGSAQDVHDQKLAADQLREIQSRFKRAVEGTLDGLWEIDLSGSRGRFWLSP
ncbi:MAG: PAS domain-containing protein, partial [Steroidobacteraceae bacterium]